MKINPEFLAEKLRQVQAQEPECNYLSSWLNSNPRLRELCWFIQWNSMQPGGVDNLAKALLAKFSARFVTSGIIAAGVPVSGHYSMEQRLAVFNADHPHGMVYIGEVLFDSDAVRERRVRKNRRVSSCLFDSNDYEDDGFCDIEGGLTLEGLATKTLREREIIMGVLEGMDYPQLSEKCHKDASSGLPRILECIGALDRPEFKPAWCPELLAVLIEFMDLHAQDCLGKLAKTQVTQRVLDELDFCRVEKVPVPFVGESRSGKTKSAETWCRAYPGLARLVTVPSGNQDREFFGAHADAFGLEYTPGTSTSGLREKVEFIYRHSGLFCLYDEAQGLIPTNYSRTTAPRRLNWVRGAVIDRGLGCAFFATPQSYRQTLDQFTKTTGYRMEQWLGRLAPAVVLPDYLSFEDALMVARTNFPGIDADYLELICARAEQTPSILKTLELSAKRAQYLARRKGRVEITIEDVTEALDYTAPAPKSPAKPVKEPAKPLQASRSAIATALPRHARRAAGDEFSTVEASVRLINSEAKERETPLLAEA